MTARFRTSARTVDMLGRQQIAGIPTAINELFKNAFDAYANRVVADFDEARDFLLLRDDGIGMSTSDFIDRWLTVGTDSKAANGTLRKPGPAHQEAARPVLGEKGIGRLAIAALGSQTVVLTRPKDEDADGNRPTTMSLLVWKLFEVPGITLDDITVPLRISSEGSTLSEEMRSALIAEATGNLDELGERVPKDIQDKIRAGLAKLAAADLDRIANLKGPTLAGDGHGTHFLITPTDETLAREVRPDANDSSEGASKLKKLLIGFSNTMSGTKTDITFKTSFVDHAPNKESKDLIGADEFFRPADFSTADHQIKGRFNDRGTFTGTLSIFNSEPRDVVIEFPRGTQGPTRCGPFDLRFGYVMAQVKESSLTDVEWATMNAKLKEIAGLYIYRDGIRVLPYGNSDHDYLRIEDRRSRHASRAFFSYRRMFGAVELTSAENPSLQEKAGREGFRENLAYKDMVAILEHFFKELAARYFNKGTELGDEFISRREELKSTERLRRQELVEGKHNELRRRFDDVLNDFAAEKPAARVALLVEQYRADIADVEDTDAAVASAEATLVTLDQISRELTVEVPSDIGLSRDLKSDLGRWQGAHAGFVTRVLAPARAVIEAELAEAEDRLGQPVLLIGEGAAEAFEDKLHEVRAETDGAIHQVRGNADALVAHAREALAHAEVAARTATEAFSAAATLDREKRALARTAAREAFEAALASARAELAAISARAFASDADAGIVQLLEEEAMEYRDQYDVDLELSQLGRAVEIINHEFAATIADVRGSLQALRPWARRNKALQPIEARLSSSFEHLDAYLSLFTPLQRRLQRRPIEVRGTAIVEFVDDLFSERADRSRVEIRATEAFRANYVVGYPSTLYPVFINLVDNALFWLGARPEPRLIELDAKGRDWIVRDNGPGVEPEIASRIFDMSVSTKPNGRGVGLKVSRDVLRRSGWDLWLVPGGGLPWPDSVPARDGQARHGAEFRFGEKDDDSDAQAGDGAQPGDDGPTSASGQRGWTDQMDGER